MDQYRAKPTDRVITDLYMPNQEGLETIIELRTRSPVFVERPRVLAPRRAGAAHTFFIIQPSPPIVVEPKGPLGPVPSTFFSNSALSRAASLICGNLDVLWVGR